MQSLEDPVKQEDSDSVGLGLGRDSAFLTISQMMLMLLVKDSLLTGKISDEETKSNGLKNLLRTASSTW